MAKSQYVNVRVSPETKAYLEEMAKRERRTVSGLISDVIIHNAISQDKAKLRVPGGKR